MTPTELARTFDLRKLDAAFYADPYPIYEALRVHEPIRQMPDGSLFLTRYRNIQSVYRDARTFSSDKTVEFGPKYGTDAPLFAHHTTSLVFNDPPRHTRVRKLIAGALTARAIAAMEPGLIILVDDFAGAGCESWRDRFDWRLRVRDSRGSDWQFAKCSAR